MTFTRFIARLIIPLMIACVLAVAVIGVFADRESDILLVMVSPTARTTVYLFDAGRNIWLPVHTFPGYGGIYRSPDGETFLYNAQLEHYSVLYNLYSGSQRPLSATSDRMEAIAPAWSPDGVWIAYANGFFGSYDIVMQAVDGSERRTINTVPGVYNLVWSPHSRYLLVGGGDSAGYQIYDVAAATHFNVVVPINHRMIHWMPDSEHLIYHDSAEAGLVRYNIYTRETELLDDRFSALYSVVGTWVIGRTVIDNGIESHIILNVDTSETFIYGNRWPPIEAIIAANPERERAIFRLHGDSFFLIFDTSNGDIISSVSVSHLATGPLSLPVGVMWWR